MSRRKDMIEPGRPGQCTAHAKSTGKRCQRQAILGGTVCAMHGGMAPQVRNKARLRLAALSGPAIETLARVMVNGQTDRARLAAADSILDRSGYHRGAKIELDDARQILIDRLIEMRNDSGRKR